MHYQIAPLAESKFVRCTQGSIYDVIEWPLKNPILSERDRTFVSFE